MRRQFTLADVLAWMLLAAMLACMIATRVPPTS